MGRSYTFAIVFKSRDPYALEKACEALTQKVPDSFVIYRHGPTTRHLFVVAGANPVRGEGLGNG